MFCVGQRRHKASRQSLVVRPNPPPGHREGTLGSREGGLGQERASSSYSQSAERWPTPRREGCQGAATQAGTPCSGCHF